MESDFLKQIHALGLTARIKRLSDSLSSGIREYYKSRGLDIEPSWHLVFLWLKQHEVSTMSEIAAAFRYSQPAMTKLLKRLQGKGYIEFKTDPDDHRRKLIRLTAKSQNLLPQFEQTWQAGQRAMARLLKEIHQLEPSLSQFEDRIFKDGFKSLAEKELHQAKGEDNHD